MSTKEEPGSAAKAGLRVGAEASALRPRSLPARERMHRLGPAELAGQIALIGLVFSLMAFSAVWLIANSTGIDLFWPSAVAYERFADDAKWYAGVLVQVLLGLYAVLFGFQALSTVPRADLSAERGNKASMQTERLARKLARLSTIVAATAVPPLVGSWLLAGGAPGSWTDALFLLPVGVLIVYLAASLYMFDPLGIVRVEARIAAVDDQKRQLPDWIGSADARQVVGQLVWIAIVVAGSAYCAWMLTDWDPTERVALLVVLALVGGMVLASQVAIRSLELRASSRFEAFLLTLIRLGTTLALGALALGEWDPAGVRVFFLGLSLFILATSVLRGQWKGLGLVSLDRLAGKSAVRALARERNRYEAKKRGSTGHTLADRHPADIA